MVENGNSRDLTLLRRKLWILCHRTSDLASRYMDYILTKQSGITYQQFLVLVILEQTNFQGTVGNIAEKLGRTQNTLSVLLDRMKRDGLVRKTRNLSDKRLVRVAVTEKGKKKLAESVDVGWNVIKDLISPLSEEEMSTMVQLIGRLETLTRERLMEIQLSKKRKIDLN